MQNRVIEIHDSELDQIELIGSDAVLQFRHAYIHASEGRPAVDPGTGWSQKAQLRIGNARIEGAFSEESRSAYGDVFVLGDGVLTIEGNVYDNSIPIPLDVHGAVELELNCWDNVVRVCGNSAKLDLIGEPRYIEEFE